MSRFPQFVVMAILLSCWAGSGSCVHADAPHVSYIFPAGGQRGTRVQFHVGGHYLRDTCPFEMIGDGIQSSSQLKRSDQTQWFEGPRIPTPASQAKEDYPREQWGELQIDAGATPGFRRWRVWTSQGVTPTMKFVVGDLPEVVEQEIDGAPVPREVSVPVTINGRIFPREDIDIWTFQATAGQHYVCEVMAQRLGSPLDSRLKVLDPNGHVVAENTDGIGNDSRLRFQAKQDGIYQVRIHDVEFGGLQHYVYRLTIRSGFYVDHVYPLGGRRGSTLPVQLFGNGGEMKQLRLEMPRSGKLHVSAPVVLDGQPTNYFPFDLSELPEFLEPLESKENTTGGSFTVPAVINGRIESAGQVDRWEFAGKKGEQLRFDVMAERLGSPLDSVMRVLDDQGTQLAQSDDRSKTESDSQVTVTLPRDGTYTVELRERFARRGGSHYAYRLYVGPTLHVAPAFTLDLPTDGVTLDRGGEVKLKVTATRHGAFSGPIRLDVLGLPWGVTGPAVSIAEKQNQATLVLKADEIAKVQALRVQVRGEAEVTEGQLLKQWATVAADSADDIARDHFKLAVSMPTPFKVVGEFETKYAARGSTYRRHYRIERGGFKGPLEIRMADRQVRHLQGIQGGSMIVPPGQAEFDYAVHLAPWMEVGRTSRTCVTAIGLLEDEDGKEHVVSYTSHGQNDQVILLVDPGQLDVGVQPRSVAWKAGAELNLVVQLGRGQGLDGVARVELVVPSHIQGVHAEPLVIPPGKTRGLLKISCDPNGRGPFNMPLTVRATVQVNGDPYTAERKMDVVAPR